MIDPETTAGAPEETPEAGQEASAAPEHAGPSRQSGIRLGQRVLAVGNTGEGKSELLAHLYAIHRGQRLLVDVQDHYELGPDAREEDALEVERVRDIDWRRRTIRYVPSSLSGREFDDLYRAIYERGNLLVWLDEAEDAAPVGRVPPWLKKTVKQGRKRRITHLAATQRPHGVERSIRNQSEHAFVFKLVDDDDLNEISYRIGLNARRLAAELQALPDHGYLRHTIGERQIVAMPPLPASIIAYTRRHIVNPG